METIKITEKLYIILNDILGTERHELTEDAHFMNDLGCDSIALSEIILRLEDEFELRISDSEVEKMVTVGNVIACIQEKLNHKKISV